MRGGSNGCAPPLFSSPLLTLLIFFTLHQLCMNISSGGIGLQQQDGVEMQLHHLSRPLSSFHPSIPHTFHVVIEFGWLPVPWITFPPGSLFSLSAGQISLSLSPLPRLFLSFSFHISFYFLLASSLPPYASVTVSHCFSVHYSLSLTHSLFPLSVHRGCNWSTTFPHIVIFKSLFATQRRESDCFIIFRFPDMVLGR